MTIKDTYLTVNETAYFTGVNKRTLQRLCEKGDCVYKIYNIRGRKTYKILVSSLKKELQYKIFTGFSFHDFAGAGEVDHPCKINNAPFSLSSDTEEEAVPIDKPASEAAKQKALAKYTVVRAYEKTTAGNKGKTRRLKIFADLFNAGNIKFLSNEFKILKKISSRSVLRWIKTLKEGGGDYYSLIDRYKFSPESEFNTTLSDLEKQNFIKIYYNDSRFNLSSAYNILKYNAERQGYRLKSERTYRRFACYIERNHKDFHLLSREGEKALNDYAVPFIKRDVSNLRTGDILVADGNKLDFMILNPFTGKPQRATMVVFMDWASRDFLGYEIMFGENTQCIASALRNAILRLGKMPKVVYMDNGRAFRGRYFNGTKTLGRFEGVFSRLGIKTCFATPYNGRAKIIERSFGEFVKTCPPAVSSYIGSSIGKKPAHLLRNEKFQKKLHKNDVVPTLEDAKKIIDLWLDFYRSKKLKSGKTIRETFEEGKGKGININILDDLMMSSAVRCAKRATIKIFNREYTSDKLYGIEKEVVVKYSLFDLSKIRVYSMKGEFITDASLRAEYNPMAKYFGTKDDLNALKQAQKHQKALIKGTKKLTLSLTGNLSDNVLPWNMNAIEAKTPESTDYLTAKALNRNKQGRKKTDFTANYDDLERYGLKKACL